MRLPVIITAIECYQPVRISGTVKQGINVAMGHTIVEYGAVGVLVDGTVLVPWTNIGSAQVDTGEPKKPGKVNR